MRKGGGVGLFGCKPLVVPLNFIRDRHSFGGPSSFPAMWQPLVSERLLKIARLTPNIGRVLEEQPPWLDSATSMLRFHAVQPCCRNSTKLRFRCGVTYCKSYNFLDTTKVYLIIFLSPLIIVKTLQLLIREGLMSFIYSIKRRNKRVRRLAFSHR